MVKEIESGGMKCVCIPYTGSDHVVYIIYPELLPFKKEWLKEMSSKYRFNIAVIYIPADGWNDMLTPWAEPGETPDSPPFAGKALQTIQSIQNEVIPDCEKILDVKCNRRDLLGVSLSGLFTLWQWILYDTFESIASLSGSFWYPGFIQWFDKVNVPKKSGKAYFLLGVKEPKAWIKAYRTVGVNTEAVVEKLKANGINTTFQWVEGDHFADPLQRAEDGLKALS